MDARLVYGDLNEVQRAYLRACGLHVDGLSEGLWQVTIVKGSKILMRDIFTGGLDAAESHGRKLGYRAALAYCAGPQRR